MTVGESYTERGTQVGNPAAPPTPPQTKAQSRTHRNYERLVFPLRASLPLSFSRVWGCVILIQETETNRMDGSDDQQDISVSFKLVLISFSPSVVLSFNAECIPSFFSLQTKPYHQDVEVDRNQTPGRWYSSRSTKAPATTERSHHHARTKIVRSPQRTQHLQ